MRRICESSKPRSQAGCHVTPLMKDTGSNGIPVGSFKAMAGVMKLSKELQLFWAASIVLWHCSAHSRNVTYMRIPTVNAIHFNSSSFQELRLVHLPLERQSSSRTDGEIAENRFLDNDLYHQCRNRFVCDLDSILNSDQIDAMERELQQFSKRFFPKNGILAGGSRATEMVTIHLHVVLLRMIQVPVGSTAKNAVEDWMRNTFPSRSTHPTQHGTRSTSECNIFLFIAPNDRQVYLVQRRGGRGECSSATILTPLRIRRLLLEMMPLLQQGQNHYLDAVRECIHGLDFYFHYGVPRFWERWYSSTAATVSFWMILIVPCFILFLSLGTILLYLHWYQLKEWYQKYTYRRRLLYYQFRLWCHRMWPCRPIGASHGSRHPVCPICLELFLCSPRKGFFWCGSDGQRCTVLRCGHVYDTTCWSLWMKRYALSNGNRIVSCAICRQEV